VRGNDGADAEERAVTKRGNHARQHQHGVVRRDGAQCVPDDEQAQQGQQGVAALQLRRERRQQRRAGSDAQRITGDQQTGGRNAHAQVRCHFRQQAHDHELGGADGEGCYRQGQQRGTRVVMPARALA